MIRIHTSLNASTSGIQCQRAFEKSLLGIRIKPTYGLSLQRSSNKVLTAAQVGWGGKNNQKGQQGGNMYPPVYQAQVASDQVTKDKLALGTALRNVGWISFWSQLVLNVVSGVILLFSIGITNQGAVQVSPLDICTLLSVTAGLVSSFLAWTWINTGRRLGMLQEVKLQRCLATVVFNININLIGMGAAILGLQATVGALVGKTLTTAASGYYGPRTGAPPVAFDIFSVQACANTIMAHFAGMVLANWLLRKLNAMVQKMDDDPYAVGERSQHVGG